MTKKADSTLFTVEGPIQALRVVPGVLNLVEDIQKGALFTGAAAGLAGQAGMLANAASLALYEGEDVEHVALLINGQLAIGTFEWLQDLNIGDDVKLVVSKIEEGPLFIHAILRKSDQLLWTPYGVDHTKHGWIVHALKLCSILFVGGWIFVGLLILGTNKGLSKDDFLLNLVISTSIIGFVGFMSTRGVMDLGEQAEDIFNALGVPKFERFRIKSFSLMMDYSGASAVSNRQQKGHIFKFADALAAHKKKFNLQ